MTSKFEDLVGAVKDSLETLANSRALTSQAKTALIEAEAALTGISRRSNSYKLTVTKEALAAAIDSLGKAEAAKAIAVDQFGEYLSEIGASRGFDYHKLAKQLDLFANRPSPKQVANPPQFNARRRNPACWQGLSPYPAAQSAEGNLFYSNGRKWNSEPIRAHFKNAETNARDLKPQCRRMRAVWHVEGSVAAWMRDEGAKDMVLYLNTTMCKYPDGCKEQVAKLLPEGATLKIHGIQTSGKPWHVNITGTGEAIQ